MQKLCLWKLSLHISYLAATLEVLWPKNTYWKSLKCGQEGVVQQDLTLAGGEQTEQKINSLLTLTHYSICCYNIPAFFHRTIEAGCRDLLPVCSRSIKWGQPLMLDDKAWLAVGAPPHSEILEGQSWCADQWNASPTNSDTQTPKYTGWAQTKDSTFRLNVSAAHSRFQHVVMWAKQLPVDY